MVNKIVVGQLQTNCYILTDIKSKQCAIIDPGAEPEKIMEFIDNKKLTPVFIIHTHGHGDHIAADNNINLPVYIHKDDAGFLTDPAKNLSQLYATNFIYKGTRERLLEDGDKIKLGDLDITVIHTPGHSPGGICLLCDNILFSGDTLFASGIGRTDLPFGNEKQIIDSIRNKLVNLPDDTKVYPGHGPETTMGVEKKDNPWMGD